MMIENKQCETCAWPLECSADMAAQKPEGADCPREERVWDRRLEDVAIAVADGAAFDGLVETEPRHRELLLV